MKPAIAVLALLLTATFTWSHHSQGTSPWRGAHGTLTPGGTPEEAAPIGSVALVHRFLQRLNADGSMPKDGMMRALRQKEVLRQAQGEEAAALSWTYLGPDNVGGRVRAIVVHPTNPSVMWVGSVGGGIWKTTNGGASWTSLNDYLPSLCVGTIVIDKNNPNTLYAGSGESYFDTQFGENNKAAIQGAGIYKTTDGGATWSQLSSTTTPDFNCVSRLSMSPADSLTLLASTNTGLFRTTDGGATWAKVYSGQVMDVDFHATDASRVVAGISTAPGVIYSSDGGLTWNNSTGISATVRCETSWSKSVSGNVYAAVCNGNAIKIWKSTNFGQTWVIKTTGSGKSNYDAYNCALWIDPTNDNNLVVGGVSVSRSTNQGVSLTTTYNNVHPDFHAVVESSAFNGTTNRTIFFGTDGGVSRAADFTTSTTNDLNNSLGITQFYGGAINNTSGRIVAGAQDNYTQVYTGSLNWTGVIGGDGVFCASDPGFPGVFYAGYYYLNIFRDDGSLNFGVDATGGISDRGNNVNCNFVPYIMLDPVQPNTMLACARRLWRTTNARTGNPPSWTVIKPPIANQPEWPRHPWREYVKEDHFAPEMPYNLSFCAVAKSNNAVIWASHNNGQVFMTTNGLAASPSWTRVDLNGPLPLRWVSCITIDPADPNHVYLSYMGWASDNVWETTDGGASFHQVTGTGVRHIPSAPVSALALDPLQPGHLIAGTDIGIFTTWDNGATWSVATQGPGTVPIDFFEWRDSSRLMAYTYGRGTWQATTGATDTLALATSFNVFRGILVSGGLAETQASDDQYLVVKNGLVLNQSESPVTVDFAGTAPATVAKSLTLACELSVTTGGLSRRLQAFDFDAATWVDLDARNATTVDQVVTVTVSTNVSRFIDPATRQMKMRVLVKPGGIVGASTWNANIDFVSWTVTQ